MPQIAYSRSDVPTIASFMESDAFIRGLMGPFGSGKSSGCIWDMINRGLKQQPGPDGVRRSRWAVIRNTYSQLNDTTIRTFHSWFPYPQFGRWRATSHEFLVNTLVAKEGEAPAQIEFLFRALDRPDHVRNLLSLDLTGAWVNEAREVPWAIIEALQGRVDRYPAKRDGGATWAGVLMDTNPPDVDSEWHQFFEDADHSEAVDELAKHIPGMTVDRYARIFKQPSGLAEDAENKSNQSPGYWHRLQIGKSSEWIKVYVRGEYGFVIDGRPVWPEYHDNIHCPGAADPDRAPRTNPKLPVYRGWDFGLTPACVYSQISSRGQWIIVDELVSRSMGVDRFSDDVLEHSSRYYPGTEFIDIGDPAGMQRAQTDERTCFMILHAKGIQIEPGLQTLTTRLESVRHPLTRLDTDGMPMFNIHPRCRILRRAMMGGYQFRKMQTSTERYSEQPDKNRFSHIADGLGYTGTRLFGPSLQFAPESDDSDLVELNSRLRTDQTRSPVTGY